MTYWFQGRQRVEADEFSARWNLFADALRRRPSDTAMVRVMTPLPSATPDAGAHDILAAFSGDMIPQLHRAWLLRRNRIRAQVNAHRGGFLLFLVGQLPAVSLLRLGQSLERTGNGDDGAGVQG